MNRWTLMQTLTKEIWMNLRDFKCVNLREGGQPNEEMCKLCDEMWKCMNYNFVKLLKMGWNLNKNFMRMSMTNFSYGIEENIWKCDEMIVCAELCYC
jgi:hypothetical protein